MDKYEFFTALSGLSGVIVAAVGFANMDNNTWYTALVVLGIFQFLFALAIDS